MNSVVRFRRAAHPAMPSAANDEEQEEGDRDRVRLARYELGHDHGSALSSSSAGSYTRLAQLT
jgi:hypothetical protein